MRILFQIATWLFMPILMPVYALLLVMYTPSQPFNLSDENSLFIFSNQNKVAILSNYILFTVIAPVAMYSIFLKLNIIKTIQLDDKKERNMPMILMAIFCFLLFYTFNSIQVVLPKYVYGLCLAGGIIITLFSILNIYFKISLHATGVGILTGFVFAYISEQLFFQLWILIFVLLVSGIVLSSRLYLNKHNSIELISGYFLSFIITFTINLYYPFLK
jgi:membrane-associated phospholipid phosphatase